MRAVVGLLVHRRQTRTRTRRSCRRTRTRTVRRCECGARCAPHGVGGSRGAPSPLSQPMVLRIQRQTSLSSLAIFFSNPVNDRLNHFTGLIREVKTFLRIPLLQVNFFQKHLFLHQLIHNMTKDCSLNYKFSTWKLHAQNIFGNIWSIHWIVEILKN